MDIIKRTIPTTNYDISRKPIKQIVIHWIVGTLASADARFMKAEEQASAHYGVEDNTIYQWVDEEHTSYAVGNYTRNQETISIEHSASPTRPASEKTYQTSGQLVREIAKRWNIPLDRKHIIGHREISATACPGTIDIEKIIELAKEGGNMGDEQCRIDRDMNWNVFNIVMDAVGIKADSNDKEGSAKLAAEFVKKMKAELLDKEDEIMYLSARVKECEKDFFNCESKRLKLESANRVRKEENTMPSSQKPSKNEPKKSFLKALWEFLKRYLD